MCGTRLVISIDEPVKIKSSILIMPSEFEIKCISKSIAIILPRTIILGEFFGPSIKSVYFNYLQAENYI